MTPLNDAASWPVMGAIAVQNADALLGQMCEAVDGDREIVRLNLIGFLTYSMSWCVCDRLPGPAYENFISVLLTSAALRSALGPVDVLAEVFRNRHAGFLAAFQDSTRSPTAIPRYFQACCSTKRRDIAYGDIHPDPRDLERMIKLWGPSANAQEQIERVRALTNPAVYPMDKFRTDRVFMMLMGIMNHVKEAIASAPTA